MSHFFDLCGHAFNIKGNNFRCNAQKGHGGGHVHVSDDPVAVINFPSMTDPAQSEVIALRAKVAELETKLSGHRKYVGKFISELYAIMVDPLEDAVSVATATKAIRESALEFRERLQNLPGNWSKDSSLETWFPLTGEELRRCHETIAELRAEVERLKARCLIEEWIAHEDAGSMMSLTVQQHAMVFDAIIAARAASTKGEDNAEAK